MAETKKGPRVRDDQREAALAAGVKMISDETIQDPVVLAQRRAAKSKVEKLLSKLEPGVSAVIGRDSRAKQDKFNFGIPGKQVNKFHCTIYYDKDSDRWMIRDGTTRDGAEKSKNGTWFTSTDGGVQRIDSEWVPLKPGTEVHLSSRFSFILPGNKLVRLSGGRTGWAADETQSGKYAFRVSNGKRDRSDESVAVQEQTDGSVQMFVADGVGGKLYGRPAGNSGALASHYAVDKAAYACTQDTDIGQAVTDVSNNLAKLYQQKTYTETILGGNTGMLPNMATTLLGVDIKDGHAVFAHRGHSRGYVISKDGEVLHRTIEHTHKHNAKIGAGLDPLKDETVMLDAAVVKALGTRGSAFYGEDPTRVVALRRGEVETDYEAEVSKPIPLPEEARVLLIPDGVTKNLSEQEIIDIVCGSDDATEIINGLINNSERKMSAEEGKIDDLSAALFIQNKN